MNGKTVMGGTVGVRDTMREKLMSMSREELAACCRDLRARIVEVTRKNGGHMASNLGTVELTVALHRVLDTKTDRLIFDVGHQAYVHKLLTGRDDVFDGLRRHGGVSGFPSRDESPHDAFGTGHASTAVSAAVGFARARDALGEHHAVVAVVGDGALSGGMTFEAINDAGQERTALMLVLNDNEMSISRNVGALASRLTGMRARPGWWRMKSRVQSALSSVPRVGKSLSRFIYRTKSGIKHLFLPGGLFEELGFIYLGPIDGHNIAEMERTFRRALSIGKPVLVHVVTQKGRGYLPAEHEPERYHGVAPYEISENSDGRIPSGVVMAGGLIECAHADRRIVAVTAAMKQGTGLESFAEAYPDRCYDVGIAEAHAVTMAAGLAAGGMKPFVAIYDTFFQRAMDSWLHDVLLQRLPVTLLLDRAGFACEDGITHHGFYSLGWLCSLPGAVVLSPKTPRDLRRMIAFAATRDAPTVIRYAKSLRDDLPADDTAVTRWHPLRACAEPEAVVIACGRMSETALEVADLLREGGILVDAVDARCQKPLDEEVLWRYRDTPMWILEDGPTAGGWGTGVSAWYTEHGMSPASVIGLPDHFFSHGGFYELRKQAGLSPDGIARIISAALRA